MKRGCFRKGSTKKRCNRSKTIKRNTLRRNKTKTKGFFYLRNKQFKGGASSEYPKILGIDTYKDKMYPISEYGIPAGPFDPSVDSNGPFGNGPEGGGFFGYGNGPFGKVENVKCGGGRRGRSRGKSSKQYSRKMRKQYSRKMRGGSGSRSTLAPQSLVNLSRSITGGVQEISNGFAGKTNLPSLNPMPYSQPIDSDTQYLRSEFPHVEADYNKSDSYVSTL